MTFDSDEFKEIVKDSLRDVFYSKPLNETLYGKRIQIEFYGDMFPAVISKNTRPEEKPYRLTWFKIVEIGYPSEKHTMARGHVDLSEDEAEKAMNDGIVPDWVSKVYDGRFKIIQPDAVLDENMNEKLFLLEESNREIELWMENKIPI